MSFKRLLLPLNSSHFISLGIVSYFGKPQPFHQWRDIHPKSPTKTFFEPIPTSNGICLGASPCFYGPFLCRFLFVSTALGIMSFKSKSQAKMDESLPGVVVSTYVCSVQTHTKEENETDF